MGDDPIVGRIELEEHSFIRGTKEPLSLALHAAHLQQQVIELRAQNEALRVRNERLEPVAVAARAALTALETVSEASGTSLTGDYEEYITADLNAVDSAKEQVRKALKDVDQVSK